MSDTTKPTSLAALALQVQEMAERQERSWRGEQFARQLRDRSGQLDKLIGQVARLIQQSAVVAAADPKARVSRAPINRAIKKLEKLETIVAIDVAKAVEPEAIDTENLTGALAGAEKELLEAWQRFAKPPKDSTAAEALADVAELEEAVRGMRVAREQLDLQSRQIPTKVQEVATVRTLHERLRGLSEILHTHGCDTEVLAFLARVRAAVRGVPVAEVLTSPKIRAWLESGKNATPFVVLHKSVLNSSFPPTA